MTNWPNPERPGVPLNPEEPGYHWVKGCDGEDTIVFWRGHGGDTHHENGDLKELDHWSKYPMWIAQEWTYLGPCLTPDEAAALQKRCEEAERERDALRRDASQEIATDELVRRLQHLGDWQAADRIEALQKRVAELEKAVIQCRSLTKFLKPQADRIAELETALKAAAEDIGNWGAYASQYFQEKWDLSGEVKRYTAIAEGKLPYRARYSMEEPKDE